jgi:hypothetical protein
LIEKTEKEYNNLRSWLVKWRKDGTIPFSSFRDGTRYHYGNETFDSLDEYLAHCAQTYRMNLWRDSGYYIEVWCEKDAIAAAVHTIAQEWNLLTFVCRGDASLSSLDSCARTFRSYQRAGYKPTILYLGDYDENGLAIPKTMRETFLKYFDLDINLIRVGVIEDHITRFNLPTRPPKGERRGERVEYAVDIDAMKPADLREILIHEIESFMPEWELQQLLKIEEAERETMRTIKL